MKITERLCPANKYSIKCPYSMNPIGVCIHNTANDASAANEVSYMLGNNSSTSFHYAVDDKEIIHAVPDNRNAWHAGDGNGDGNRKYISIEICYSKSGGSKFEKAMSNAAWLTAKILKDHGWGIDRVKKHQDFSGKYCPHRILESYGWGYFLNMVQTEIYKLNGGDKEMVDTTSIKINGTECSINRILKDGKNYICLADLKGKGFNVGYDANTKTPSLDVDIKDIAVLIDGKETSVRGINVNGTNLVAMRDIIDRLGGLAIDYKEKPVITKLK